MPCKKCLKIEIHWNCQENLVIFGLFIIFHDIPEPVPKSCVTWWPAAHSSEDNVYIVSIILLLEARLCLPAIDYDLIDW